MHFVSILSLGLPAVLAVPTPVIEARALSYKQGALYYHNIHRANHSAPDLKWDDQVASTAMTVAKTCNFAHKMDVDGGGYGQNLAAGTSDKNITRVITGLWYGSEVGSYANYYGQEPPGSELGKYGHFTQVVWSGTTLLGCATKDCSASGLKGVGSNVPPIFTVCNYKGPGNYLGQFAKNVGKPLGKPTVNWSAEP